MESASNDDLHAPHTATIVRSYWPRFVRDAFGPVLSFYVGYRLAGLPVGIGLSTLAAYLGYRYERNHARTGALARLSFAFVLVQAAFGLVSRSATLYLALPVLQNAVFGVAFFVSAAVGRPLTGLFAQDMHPIPSEVRGSRTYRRVFGRSSVVWGMYTIGRAAVRLWALLGSTLGVFVMVNLVTGIPLMAAMTVWSIRDAIRGFELSDEFDGAPDPADSRSPAAR